jgi:phosphatidyl-myo-inositol dimannoside synthase
MSKRNDASSNNAILCLVTDAYGGTGGIALYNRDVIAALAADAANARIVCLPRVAPNPLEAIPARVENDQSGLAGNLAYLRAVIRHARSGKLDLIYCAHVNLIPLAQLASTLSGAPWALCLYGLEAWTPFPRTLPRSGVAKADGIVSLSQVTLDRFLTWCSIDPARCVVVPNAVHIEQFAMTAKDPALLAKHGLGGKKVIMTLGRLDPVEQAKGFDRVIAVLPQLIEAEPDIAYLIVGTGGDKPRLEALASEHGVTDRVVFAGFVKEEEKSAYYNLADAYVMPSVYEGFGFVFIEALACGVPCVASNADGGQEAVLHGELGAVVDPHDQTALKAAILEALAKPKAIPERLNYYSFDNFKTRINAALHDIIRRGKH